MGRLFLRTLLPIIVLLIAAGALADAQTAKGSGEAVLIGEWKGSLVIRQAGNAASLNEVIQLRILQPGRGALLSMPGSHLYGYPLDDVAWDGQKLSFSFGALGSGEELRFEGRVSSAASGTKTILGTASSQSWKGSFTLRPETSSASENEEYLRFPVDAAWLPGTFLPAAYGLSPAPLAVLVAGAGATDRDGNNYNVPGRTDSLLQLAASLSEKGVSTFRYDKRGSGEAYTLGAADGIADYARDSADLASAVKAFIDRSDVSRIIIVGMNEGAWVGALAVRLLESQGIYTDGLVALAVSGKKPSAALYGYLEGLDEDTRREAKQILQAIEEGREYPEPSPILADFFAYSRADRLRSWLAFDPAAAMANLPCPAVLVYGGADLQVPRADFELLLDADPRANARVIPDMNHVLKAVQGQEQNYMSFNDPSFPLPEALPDLVSAFARAKPAPSGAAPYAR